MKPDALSCVNDFTLFVTSKHFISFCKTVLVLSVVDASFSGIDVYCRIATITNRGV